MLQAFYKQYTMYFNYCEAPKYRNFLLEYILILFIQRLLGQEEGSVFFVTNIFKNSFIVQDNAKLKQLVRLAVIEINGNCGCNFTFKAAQCHNAHNK